MAEGRYAVAVGSSGVCTMCPEHSVRLSLAMHLYLR
jgi:hypothetical protein